jgi:hypothetical protein
MFAEVVGVYDIVTIEKLSCACIQH